MNLKIRTAKRVPAFRQMTNKLLQRNTCVEVSGLSWNATVDTVKEFFKGADIAPNGIYLVMNREGKAAGSAFVEFATSADCSKGVARNREVHRETIHRGQAPSQKHICWTSSKGNRGCMAEIRSTVRHLVVGLASRRM